MTQTAFCLCPSRCSPGGPSSGRMNGRIRFPPGSPAYVATQSAAVVRHHSQKAIYATAGGLMAELHAMPELVLVGETLGSEVSVTSSGEATGAPYNICRALARIRSAYRLISPTESMGARSSGAVSRRPICFLWGSLKRSLQTIFRLFWF